MRTEVSWFAGEMEKRLKANDNKGGWQSCSIWWLYKRLLEETGELAEVLSGARDGNSTKEAADVANFAMMIADQVEKGAEGLSPEGRQMR